ncbi:MAG: tol-pal system protein YbgF [Burkholderiaceae bacterium]|jgi:tol-pal system protein YbgF|nr:tol-pal system protein YbgF [Burkholderiales bacterium]TAL70982.1 MAG: tol-pal system protein YbgF [Burkholderiaceae bacterium]TBR75881.1 MAG: tol-pal system protein YbgF [Burkholderiaceae bacterium]
MRSVQARKLLRGLVVATSAWAALTAAHAGLFADDDARRAILEMRQRFDTLQAAQTKQASDASKSLLDLQTQIESLRSDLATLRGQNEQLTQDVANLQQQQKTISQNLSAQLAATQPTQVTVDGQTFSATPQEKADYEAALATFRQGDFAGAQTAFTSFIQKYPQSGYNPSALFWLGNAQYATRDYKGAIGNFRALVAQSPTHARAPESVLSIANCQIELGDTKAARKTLGDLLKAYPQSEAAQAAKERLAKLK